jgi:general L-amino acid transport system ATP-binding protein
MTPPAIAMHRVNKWYGQYHALRDVSLDVRRGERLAICGPSGSGKSTLIRCLNGLETHQSGEIAVDGYTIDDHPRRIQAVRRRIGMVFQHLYLFPHLTVLENCTLAPIRVRAMPRAEAEHAAMHYLFRLQIGNQAHKYPSALSGGQQQRVAIARALTMSPGVLVLDEPTSALDDSTSGDVLEMLHAIAGEGRTILCVTHDMAFARDLADRIVFMDAGTIVESTYRAALAR